MSDMSFLEGGSTEIVSTGNKTVVKYNEYKAHIEQPFTIPLETPYVQRAIELAKSMDFTVVPTLKAALELRNDKQKVVSYREADIMLRKGLSKSSAGFIWQSLESFGAFMSEDDDKFTSGIFLLRSRFNKGIEWMHTPAPGKTKEKLMEGADRLEQIKLDLIERGLPLHEEELGNGIHQEFLKPEHLAWRQYVAATSRSVSRSISDKQEPSYKW